MQLSNNNIHISVNLHCMDCHRKLVNIGSGYGSGYNLQAIPETDGNQDLNTTTCRDMGVAFCHQQIPC